MAQVDSRIAMGVQPLDVGAAVGKGYQLRDLSAQADARTLDTQIKQQALKKQGTVADLYKLNTQNGKLDRSQFTQGLSDAGYGQDVGEHQKQWSDADKAEAERMSKDSERIMKTLDYTGKALGGLLANPNTTGDDVIRTLSGLVSAGLMTPEQGAKAAREVPGDPGQLRQFLQQKAAQALQAKDSFAAALPQLQAINLGGSTQMVDTNPLTNPQANGQAMQRTPTPGELESQRNNAERNALTVRGQDMTDIRARDLNQTRVEENALKRDAKNDAANLTHASQIASFDTMLGTLDRLSKHDGLERSVGTYGAFPTMPGSESANFQAELNTFQSQAFLPMVAQLKGMGALSDAEGKKLTAAVGALDTNMGEKAFRKSIALITKDMEAAKKRMVDSRPQQKANPANDDGGGVLLPDKEPASPVLDQAKVAIAAGADRAKVIERLKGMGLDTKGL